jgi:hypothetical protein
VSACVVGTSGDAALAAKLIAMTNVGTIDLLPSPAEYNLLEERWKEPRVR